MRICIDLDRTICNAKKEGQTYEEVSPKFEVVEKLMKWHLEGHYIIIHTARHMVTCNGNVELVISKMKDLTEKWLKDWGIWCDELIFGKPLADVYIDDKALKFEDNWDTIQLPIQG